MTHYAHQLQRPYLRVCVCREYCTVQFITRFSEVLAHREQLSTSQSLRIVVCTRSSSQLQQCGFCLQFSEVKAKPEKSEQARTPCESGLVESTNHVDSAKLWARMPSSHYGLCAVIYFACRASRLRCFESRRPLFIAGHLCVQLFYLPML